jgi:hypothetical protein
MKKTAPPGRVAIYRRSDTEGLVPLGPAGLKLILQLSRTPKQSKNKKEGRGPRLTSGRSLQPEDKRKTAATWSVVAAWAQTWKGH